MPVRLVAADLDGTLVGRDGATPRVAAAVMAVRSRGIPVVAVTARRWWTAAALTRALGLGPLAVVAGGATLRDVADGSIVECAELAATVVAAAVAAIAGAGLQPMVGVDGAERHLTGPPELDGPAARIYLAGRSGELGGDTERHAISELGRPAARVLAMGEVGPVSVAAAGCAGLDARVVVQDCIVQIAAAALQHELHVCRADKGDGLLRACERLGVHPDDVLAIGDAPSDLPMLDLAGTAVLMGQAGGELRRPGYVVAPGIALDGAAWALERMVLGTAR